MISITKDIFVLESTYTRKTPYQNLVSLEQVLDKISCLKIPYTISEKVSKSNYVRKTVIIAKTPLFYI